MAIFQKPKLIRSSDFPQDNQEFASMLGNILNITLEQLYSVLDRGVDFNNLNQDIITFQVKVDSTGTPKGTLELKSSLKSKIRGTQVIKVVGNTYPTSNPLISFDYSSTNNTIMVNNITSLTADVAYTITVILYG